MSRQQMHHLQETNDESSGPCAGRCDLTRPGPRADRARAQELAPLCAECNGRMSQQVNKSRGTSRASQNGVQNESGQGHAQGARGVVILQGQGHRCMYVAEKWTCMCALAL